jgi:hypothetical protein
MNITEFTEMVREIERDKTVDISQAIYTNGMSDGVRAYLLSLDDAQTMEETANLAVTEIASILDSIS